MDKYDDYTTIKRYIESCKTENHLEIVTNIVSRYNIKYFVFNYDYHFDVKSKKHTMMGKLLLESLRLKRGCFIKDGSKDIVKIKIRRKGIPAKNNLTRPCKGCSNGVTSTNDTKD